MTLFFADVMNQNGDTIPQLSPKSVSPNDIYCDMIRYLTQNKKPLSKEGLYVYN